MKKLLVVGLFCSMMIVGCDKQESPDIPVKEAFGEAANIAEDAIENVETTAVESTEIVTVEAESGVDEDYVQNAVQDRQEKVESGDYIVLNEQYLGEKPKWGKFRAYNDPSYPNEVAVYDMVRTVDKDYPDIDKVLEISENGSRTFNTDCDATVPSEGAEYWTSGKFGVDDELINLGITYDELIVSGWEYAEDLAYDSFDANVDAKDGVGGFFRKGDDVIRCWFFNYDEEKAVPAKECNLAVIKSNSYLYWYGSKETDYCNFNIDGITPTTTFDEIESRGWIPMTSAGTEDGSGLFTLEYMSEDGEYYLSMVSVDGVHPTEISVGFTAVMKTPKILQ